MLYDQIKNFAFSQTQDVQDFMEYITQGEHPFIGVAFYNLHPCKVSNFDNIYLCELNLDD